MKEPCPVLSYGVPEPRSAKSRRPVGLSVCVGGSAELDRKSWSRRVNRNPGTTRDVDVSGSRVNAHVYTRAQKNSNKFSLKRATPWVCDQKPQVSVGLQIHGKLLDSQISFSAGTRTVESSCLDQQVKRDLASMGRNLPRLHTPLLTICTGARRQQVTSHTRNAASSTTLNRGYTPEYKHASTEVPVAALAYHS